MKTKTITATQKTINSINDLYRDYKKVVAAQASIHLQFFAAVKRAVQDHHCGGSKCFVAKTEGGSGNALCKEDKALATAVVHKWDRITGIVKPAILDHKSKDLVDIYACKVEVLAMDLVPAVKSFNPAIRRYEKSMVALVNTLPIAKWADALPGFSTLGLAKIMAEAGNEIGKYRNPSCLWKRFGLGLVRETAGGNLVRQRRRTGTENGIIHGFSPTRRALMFVVQGTIYQNGKLKDNEYYEYAQNVTAKAILDHPDWTKAHLYMHQRRLLAKRFLRDLWVEWDKCMPKTVRQTAPPALVLPAAPEAKTVES